MVHVARSKYFRHIRCVVKVAQCQCSTRSLEFNAAALYIAYHDLRLVTSATALAALGGFNNATVVRRCTRITP